MFARFDENPAMTLRVIKETKPYGRTDGRTDGKRENSIPPTNKVCGGYNYTIMPLFLINQSNPIKRQELKRIVLQSTKTYVFSSLKNISGRLFFQVPNSYTYDKCSKISNIFLFLFSNKMLVFRAEIHSQNVCQPSKQRRP